MSRSPAPPILVPDPDALGHLRSQVGGPVHAPGDPGYDAARRPWNLAVDPHPAVVVEVASTDDVVVAMRFARAMGLQVAVQATGHGVTRAADGALLVLTGRLDAVEVDGLARRARVGGGVMWGPVLTAAHAHGLAPLLGSAPHVGAVGYTLGGGMGWLARRHGLSADRVVSFELVTPDGTVREVSRTREPELFDALRGGGAGTLGVVTGMEIELVEVGTVTGGNLLYPVEMASEVMARFRDWAAALPDEMTAAVTVMNYPPLEQVPAAVRGRSFVIVRGCHCGEAAEAERLLAYWRDWRAPELDLFGPLPFSEVAAISQDPVDPMPGAVTSEVLAELTDDAIEAVVAHTVPDDGPPLVVFTELRCLGGAIGRGDSPVGDRLRDGAFVAESVAVVPTPDLAPVVAGAMADLRAGLHHATTGAAYLNFLEEAERRDRAAAAMTPQAWENLCAVKAAVDPDGVMAYGLDLPVPRAEAAIT